MARLSKLHSRCRYKLCEEKQVIWEQKQIYTLLKLERKPIGLLKSFSHGFSHLIFGVQWKSWGYPYSQKKQFRNLNRRFVNIWAEKIGRVEKISPLLRLERFEVKQVVFGRTQAFVKVLFVIEQEFWAVWQKCILCVQSNFTKKIDFFEKK